MHIRNLIDRYKASEILTLKYEGKVLGLRVKCYNAPSDSYLYYDFSINYVKGNEQVFKFITSIYSSCKGIELIENENDLASRDEVEGKISVTEFKDFNDAIRVLTPMVSIYKYLKGGNVNV